MGFCITKISNILPNKIKQILKASYDALDKEEQQMFLDVACFFIAEQKDMLISIWDGSSSDGGVRWSGWYGFQILENKCLVEVDHENRIRMHDHLRDLGREIAIKETPSRFWSRSQFVHSQRPLEERLPIRGVMAATGSRDGYCNSHYEPPFEEFMQLLMGHSTSGSRRITPSALGLQLLDVRGDDFKEEFAKLSEELVWLRWYDFPHEKLPLWLSTDKLRVLELYRANRLADLWGPNDPPPQQLRELIINLSQSYSCNLPRIPKTIGILKHLKKLVLKPENNWGEINISSLPEEFCLLESLEHLELQKASDLSSLPTHFRKLRKLKYINLSGCRRLTALPVSFNQLTELQCLDLSWCKNLQLEKEILENITKLEKLRLVGCSKLQQLPREITRQIYLRELILYKSGLRELPADIDRLEKLEVLDIGSDCLTSLPTSLGNLPSLIKLKIRCCGQLTHLPSLGCLTRLEDLYLTCSGVEYLPEGFRQLVNLQNLDIWCCPIKDLPLSNPEESYSKKLPKLKSITLFYIKESTISISEDCCPGLEKLRLQENHDLMEIETLPPTLKEVSIVKCQKLENIRVFAGAELQHLKISCCPIRELPLANPEQPYSSMFKYPRLKHIDLVNTKISTISICEDCCPSLEELSLDENHDLMEIETLPTSLKRVKISTSEKLDNIRVVAGLAELQHLEISGCPIRELPVAGLAELQHLKISGCPIRELPLANPEERYSKKPRLLNHVDSSIVKFPRLSFITLCRTKVSTISISEDCCPSLASLSLYENHDIVEIETLPTTLKSVFILSSPRLDRLPSFSGLVQLQSLGISECPGLDELPSFACCTGLEYLEIGNNSRVTKIEGIEELRSLKELRLETCWKEPGIKGLKNLDKLTKLYIRAESRSAIETCIPSNIMKRACRMYKMDIVGRAVEDVACRMYKMDIVGRMYKMEIVGRAVEDVESVVDTLSFPNFTVVDTLHRVPEGLYHKVEWEIKLPLSNASCIMACFVISSSFQGIEIRSYVSTRGQWGCGDYGRPISLLEGKQVYIFVRPKGFNYNCHVECGERVFLCLERSTDRGSRSDGTVEIEKGMAVIMRKGEKEEKALEEAFHKFLALLAR